MIALLLLLVSGLADSTTGTERLIFTKIFPGSQPPYVGITIDRSGTAEYRSDPKDEQPILFRLRDEEASELFALAAKVDLSKTLEAPVHVAKMGMKTIRLERGANVAEQSFNYTEDADARLLLDWFERVSESEQRFLDLERTAKYEKIGVNEAILLLQVTWERKRLVAPQQFLPLLDRIAGGNSYVRMARDRASGLAATFRSLP